MLNRTAQLAAILALGALVPALPHALRQADDDNPVAVRYSEGTAHGFLHLTTAGGQHLASGDLLQVPRDRHIRTRMVFHFADSSYFEETVTFTQHDVFRLLSYHLVHRGPSFPADLDASFEANGHYVVKATSHDDGKVEQYEDTLDLPADVSNGLPIVLLKNLVPDEARTVHIVAFTPKPRLIGLELTPVAKHHVLDVKRRESVVEYALKPKLGLITGLFAKLLAKTPPDSHVWIVTEGVPAFVRFEGPLYMGPVWRIDLTAPHWPE